MSSNSTTGQQQHWESGPTKRRRGEGKAEPPLPPPTDAEAQLMKLPYPTHLPTTQQQHIDAATPGGASEPTDGGAAAGTLSIHLPNSAGPLQHTPSTVEFAGVFEHDYELGEVLGRGTFSIVYRCTKRGTGEQRAVKVIDTRRFKLSSAFRATSVLDEVCILRSLHHPNIIRVDEVYDGLFQGHEAIFIVSELAAGGELFDSIIKAGNFSEAQARHVIYQALDALRYMHARGIMHRDLKPENLLVISTAYVPADDPVVRPQRPAPPAAASANAASLVPMLNIKVADFGVARYIGAAAAGATTFVGSPQYVAPEVLFARDFSSGLTPPSDSSGGEPDPRTSTPAPMSPSSSYGKEVDVYSLGVILYVCLAGYLPFDDGAPKPAEAAAADAAAARRPGARMETWEDRVRVGKYYFAPPVWTHISEGAKDLIHRMMEVNPARRISVEGALGHAWFAPIREALGLQQQQQTGGGPHAAAQQHLALLPGGRGGYGPQGQGEAVGMQLPDIAGLDIGGLAISATANSSSLAMGGQGGWGRAGLPPSTLALGGGAAPDVLGPSGYTHLSQQQQQQAVISALQANAVKQQQQQLVLLSAQHQLQQGMMLLMQQQQQLQQQQLQQQQQQQQQGAQAPGGAVAQQHVQVLDFHQQQQHLQQQQRVLLLSDAAASDRAAPTPLNSVAAAPPPQLAVGSGRGAPSSGPPSSSSPSSSGPHGGSILSDILNGASAPSIGAEGYGGAGDMRQQHAQAMVGPSPRSAAMVGPSPRSASAAASDWHIQVLQTVAKSLDFSSLLLMQRSTALTLEAAYLAVRDIPAAAAVVRQHSVSARALQERVLNTVLRCRAIGQSIFAILPDLKESVLEGDPGLTQGIFGRMREWVGELKAAATGMQAAYSQLVMDVQLSIEHARALSLDLHNHPTLGADSASASPSASPPLMPVAAASGAAASAGSPFSTAAAAAHWGSSSSPQRTADSDRLRVDLAAAGAVGSLWHPVASSSSSSASLPPHGASGALAAGAREDELMTLNAGGAISSSDGGGAGAPSAPSLRGAPAPLQQQASLGQSSVGSGLSPTLPHSAMSSPPPSSRAPAAPAGTALFALGPGAHSGALALRVTVPPPPPTLQPLAPAPHTLPFASTRSPAAAAAPANVESMAGDELLDLFLDTPTVVSDEKRLKRILSSMGESGAMVPGAVGDPGWGGGDLAAMAAAAGTPPHLTVAGRSGSDGDFPVHQRGSGEPAAPAGGGGGGGAPVTGAGASHNNSFLSSSSHASRANSDSSSLDARASFDPGAPPAAAAAAASGTFPASGAPPSSSPSSASLHPDHHRLPHGERKCLGCALADLRQVDGVLLKAVQFWTKMELVIDVVVRRKDHSETLLRHSSSARMVSKATASLADYSSFWQAFVFLCGRYVETAKGDVAQMYAWLNADDAALDGEERRLSELRRALVSSGGIRGEGGQALGLAGGST